MPSSENDLPDEREKLTRGRLLRMLGASLLIWTAVCSFTIVNTYRSYTQSGKAVTVSGIVVKPLLNYWIWAGLSLPVYFVTRRFPLTLRRMKWSIPVHVVTFFAFDVAWVALRYATKLAGLPSPEFMTSFSAALKVTLTEAFLEFVWVYGAAVAVCHALMYYADIREREIRETRLREQLAQHELQLLKLRLHPHFLFNTLNGISAILASDPSRARTALAQLSDLLRMALNHSEREMISLREEMEFVSSYLSLQKMRLGERLSITLDVSPAVADARVPNMILQPVVENAIRHGIEPRRSPGHVHLSAGREGEWLRLSVRNTTGHNAESPGHGIGLASLRTRLFSLYGRDQELEFEKLPDSDVRVTISIPFALPARREAAAPSRTVEA